MSAPFGGSAGLLQRLRPQRVDVADLREVAGTVLPALSTNDLRVRLVQRPRGGSVVVIEEHERCVQTPLGELADDMTAFDALRVSLPVGTVSGAPKVRAMQIIDELEPTRRGPYGGAVGYVDFSGNMDTCIALRTIVWKNGVFDVQAGAGVVADSVPASEYEETMNKAKAMLKAVEIAEKGF